MMRPRKNVLLIGDIGYDIDVHCSSRRSAQEDSSVPVLVPDMEHVRPGMALKVLELLRKKVDPLLVKVRMEARVNTSLRNPAYRRLLGKIPLVKFTDLPESTTTAKVRYYKDFKLQSRVDHDAVVPKRPAFNPKLYSNLDYLIISDYNKGAYTDEELRNIIRMQPESCKVIVDPHPSRDIGTYVGCDLIKVNSDEAKKFGMNYLLRGFKNVIMTDGPNTVKWFQRAWLRGKFDPVPTKIALDTVGAGDAFFAGLVASLVQDNRLTFGSVSVAIMRGNSSARNYLMGEIDA